MKKFLIGLISVISIFGLLSCENASSGLDPLNNDLNDNSLARRHGGGNTSLPCPAEGEFAGFNELNPDYSVYNYTLWADKDTDVGDVSITNDDENIYVTYTTDETLLLDKVQVFVWTSLDDLPNRRPLARDADYAAEDIDAFTTTVVIPAAVFCDDAYYITAQAKLYEPAACDDDEDDDDDDCGCGNNGHNNDHGRGHQYHGNGHGYGHDRHRSITAYAGDAASPACFDDAGRKWWSYVSYSVDCFASISGTVYDDADNSGDFGANEVVFDGITVTASGSDGNIYSAVTELDGSYLFASLPTGLDYTVISATPEGDYDSGENAGGYIVTALEDDVIDANFGFYSSVVLSSCVMTSTLWTDDYTDVGTVSIVNDGDNLYITYDTNELADLAEVHLALGTFATLDFRNIGDPATYSENSYVDIFSLPADAITVTIPFAAGGFTCADLLIVKAHAVLTDDAISGSMTYTDASTFGADNYGSTRDGWYGDMEYYSCCPSGVR